MFQIHNRGGGNTDVGEVYIAGKTLIGHTASDDRDGYNSSLQVSGTSGDDSSITIGRWSNNASNPALVFSKSRNGTIGSHTLLQGNDYLGAIQFQGDDGSNYHVGASIQARVENFSGAAATDDMSTRLFFNTNRDEANVANRMIIHGRGSDYNVLYGGRVDILGYEGHNITGGTNGNVLNEQLLICPSAASGYADNHTITFGQTKGDWYDGVNSSYHTSFGLLWNWGNTGYAATRAVRAGIHYDHRAQERFKFWTSYGDFVFKTDAAQSGNETAETCDTTAMQITHDGHVTKPNQPSFYATANSGGTTNMSSTHTLTNWRTSTSGKTYNTGSHFNTSNGRFTAPVAGTYIFTGSILLQNYDQASGIHMMWRKNGSNYQYWYNTRTSDIDRSGYGGYLAQGSTTTFYLSANDYVDVACTFNGTLKLWTGDANWGHFSAMLLG
tara:strand:- start:380 stop:1702 length:1323 start_codon:yes stop_codon:yes gene_type:complete